MPVPDVRYQHFSAVQQNTYVSGVWTLSTNLTNVRNLIARFPPAGLWRLLLFVCSVTAKNIQDLSNTEYFINFLVEKLNKISFI